MPNIFLISDTHFSHQNICTFYNNDGTKMRPWDNVEEMDEFIISQWNKTVGKKDKVYHLGDVVIHKKALPIVARLNGDKVLILGNHECEKASVYLKYFRAVRACHRLDKLFLSHIPIHPESIKKGWINVHGHLHCNVVKKIEKEPSLIYDTFYRSIPDIRYVNVSVEQINYTPIPLETIKKCLLKLM